MKSSTKSQRNLQKTRISLTSSKTLMNLNKKPKKQKRKVARHSVNLAPAAIYVIALYMKKMATMKMMMALMMRSLLYPPLAPSLSQQALSLSDKVAAFMSAVILL